MQKFRVMVAVRTLVSVACVGKSGSNGELSADPVVLDIAEALQDDPNFAMSDEKANCAAQRIVHGLDDTTLDQMLANPDTDLAEIADDEAGLEILFKMFALANECGLDLG